MSAWSSLTPTQVTQIQAFMTAFRPLVGQFGRLQLDMQTLDNNYTGGVQAALASLDSGTIVVDATGLAGALPQTTDSIQAAMATIASLLATYNTVQQQQYYMTAAGINALMP